jgi:hypothetical protein
MQAGLITPTGFGATRSTFTPITSVRSTVDIEIIPTQRMPTPAAFGFVAFPVTAMRYLIKLILAPRAIHQIAYAAVGLVAIQMAHLKFRRPRPQERSSHDPMNFPCVLPVARPQADSEVSISFGIAISPSDSRLDDESSSVRSSYHSGDSSDASLIRHLIRIWELCQWQPSLCHVMECN